MSAVVFDMTCPSTDTSGMRTRGRPSRWARRRGAARLGDERERRRRRHVLDRGIAGTGAVTAGAPRITARSPGGGPRTDVPTGRPSSSHSHLILRRFCRRRRRLRHDRHRGRARAGTRGRRRKGVTIMGGPAIGTSSCEQVSWTRSHRSRAGPVRRRDRADRVLPATSSSSSPNRYRRRARPFATASNALPPALVQTAHLDRLPHVVIEHQRRRPLVSRNSQPHDGPGHRRTRARRAPSASSATASTATAKRMRRGSAAGQSRRQPRRPRRRARGAGRRGMVAGERLEVGPRGAAILRERREDAVQHEPQGARGLELVVAHDGQPAPAHHAEPAAPARERRRAAQRIGRR